MVTKDKPNKISTLLLVKITGEFYDDEATEETLRYYTEQTLEDAGYDVNVSFIPHRRNPFMTSSNVQWT